MFCRDCKGGKGIPFPLSVCPCGGCGGFVHAVRARLRFLLGTGIFCPWHGHAGRSFPLAGKNQRAPGGSQIETAPWLPPDPSSLGLGTEPHVERGYSLPRGGGLEQLWMLRQLSAGGRAAPVGRPRCARGGGSCAQWWIRTQPDRSETLHSSAASHGRRRRSNLRRPPQEVAASLDHDGAHNVTRSGATVGEPRPSACNKKAFPGGEGVTAVAVTDRGSLACSASRRAQ